MAISLHLGPVLRWDGVGPTATITFCERSVFTDAAVSGGDRVWQTLYTSDLFFDGTVWGRLQLLLFVNVVFTDASVSGGDRVWQTLYTSDLFFDGTVWGRLQLLLNCCIIMLLLLKC